MKTYQKGFTLVEISVAAFLLVTLGFAILGIVELTSESQVFGFRSYTSVDDGNFALSQIARELRSARSGNNGAYTIVSGNDNEIIFYSDIDYDDQSEYVHYYVNGSALYKSVIEPSGFPITYPPENASTKLLTENLVNTGTPLFLYFNDGWPQDTANNPLITPVDIAEVRLVRISLTINPAPEIPRQNYSLNTYVQLRMLKDNL